ncbi:hypothetical protein [Sporolactobacillus pectinivorans]|uniref:hypothetical protein n=1 Tax=Sporolactobacillus pectinivorans TaxID=1591408 RepID=UPI001876FA92|nr:hypothetical protein [Sporolactobacillus pectinivorans]
MLVQRYIDRIHQIYPDLKINSAERNTTGQNNDVLIVNKALVFRFPKYKAWIFLIIASIYILMGGKSLSG